MNWIISWTIGGYVLGAVLLAIGTGIMVWEWAADKHSVFCHYAEDVRKAHLHPENYRPRLCSCKRRVVYTVLLSIIAPITFLVFLERAILVHKPRRAKIGRKQIDDTLALYEEEFEDGGDY